MNPIDVNDTVPRLGDNVFTAEEIRNFVLVLVDDPSSQNISLFVEITSKFLMERDHLSASRRAIFLDHPVLKEFCAFLQENRNHTGDHDWMIWEDLIKLHTGEGLEGIIRGFGWD